MYRAEVFYGIVPCVALLYDKNFYQLQTKGNTLKPQPKVQSCYEVQECDASKAQSMN